MVGFIKKSFAMLILAMGVAGCKPTPPPPPPSAAPTPAPAPDPTPTPAPETVPPSKSLTLEQKEQVAAAQEFLKQNISFTEKMADFFENYPAKPTVEDKNRQRELTKELAAAKMKFAKMPAEIKALVPQEYLAQLGQAQQKLVAAMNKQNPPTKKD